MALGAGLTVCSPPGAGAAVPAGQDQPGGDLSGGLSAAAAGVPVPARPSLRQKCGRHAVCGVGFLLSSLSRFFFSFSFSLSLGLSLSLCVCVCLSLSLSFSVSLTCPFLSCNFLKIFCFVLHFFVSLLPVFFFLLFSPPALSLFHALI